MKKTKAGTSAVVEKKEKAITQKPVAPLAVGQKGPQRGFEGGVDQEDLVIPRAKLIQALSPEMADKNIRKEFPDLQIGSIVNSLTKEPLGEEFIPIFMFKNYIRFNPRSKDDANFAENFEPGAIIWRSNDPLDPKVQAETKFGDNGEKPAATTFLNFFCFFPTSPMPIIISFSKTSYKAGKQLLSLAKFGGGDIFSRKYKLTSDMETNDIATFAVLKVQAAGMTEPDQFAFCEKLWNEYANKAKEIRVHDQEKDATETDNAAERPY